MQQKEEEPQPSLWEAFRLMSRNWTFIWLVLAMSSMCFIITNVQFWMSDYLIAVLNLNEKKVFFAFAFVCITSPTSGAAISGSLGDVLEGGY